MNLPSPEQGTSRGPVECARDLASDSFPPGFPHLHVAASLERHVVGKSAQSYFVGLDRQDADGSYRSMSNSKCELGEVPTKPS